MASRRTFFLAGFFALAGYLAWGITTAGYDETTAPQQVPISINGGSAAGHRMTTPSWTILYDHVEASTDSNFINARGIRDAVIYRHGKPYIHLKADHIEINLASKDFTATGHLHAEQRSNGVSRTFETGTAAWIEAKQHLEMPQIIHLKIKDVTLVVHGLTFDVPTGSVKIGPLTAHMHM